MLYILYIQQQEQIYIICHWSALLQHWGWDKMAAIFPDGIFKYVVLNEKVWIWIKISLKFVPKGPASNIPTLVQITAWCCSGNKPLSEPMMVTLQRIHASLGLNELTNWNCNILAAILQTSYSVAFYWIELIFWFICIKPYFNWQ